MRSGLGLALLLGLVSAGCYSPSYHNGNLRCTASGQCPESYHCAADNTCWRNGSDPDVGGSPDAAGTDAAASPEAGTTGRDTATSAMDSPLDLSVRTEVAPSDLSPALDVAPKRDSLLGPDSLVPDAPTGDSQDAPATDAIPDAPALEDVADAAGIDTAAGGVPLEQLAAEYAQAVCARNFACCTQEDLRGKSLTVCERDVANLFKPAVDAITKGIASGRTVYHPDRATQCLKAISEADCADWPLNPVTQLPQICDNAIDSLVPRGGACQSAAECVTRLCIGASSSADGVCQLKATSGEGCTQIFGQNSCAGENYCDSTNTCAATKVEGAACANSRECKSMTCVRVVPDAGTLSCVPAACYSSGPLLPPACSIGGRPSAFAGLALAALALLLRRRSRNRRAG